MHDRTVRRRRAVLVVLVAASLFLLTVYFGEGSSGGLHSVQRGAMGVLSPIQEGANRVLKPFRDLFGWFGDTLDAKGQRDRYKQQAEAFHNQVASLQYQNTQLRQQAGLKKLDDNGMDRYGPVDAHVFLRSPNAFYQRMSINKGTNDGVHRGDPVIASGGLIGKVEEAIGGSAAVTLITDQDFSVAALAGPKSIPGTIQPAIGAPGDLLLGLVQQADQADQVRMNDPVYTAGTVSSRPDLASRYPPGILIGYVTRIDPGTGDLDRRIHVKPTADLSNTAVVQVLTDPHADLRTSTQ
jgi:rod shape-determining protein MreC